MSFFKEKDDIFTSHFRNLCNEDSNSDSNDDDEYNYADDDKSLNDSIEIKTKSKQQEIKTIVQEQDEDSEVESPLKKIKTTNETIDYITIDDCDITNNNLSDNVPVALRKAKRKCTKKQLPSAQVITISSDDEDNNNIPENSITNVDSNSPAEQLSIENVSLDQEKKQVNNLNISQDYDDYHFNLKITIAGTYKQFATTYKTKLSEAIKDLLDQLKMEDKGLIIRSSSGLTIPLDESPYSLELTPGVILEAIEISLVQNNNDDVFPNQQAPNQIRVKVQDGNRKNTKEFIISKDQPLLHLKEIYAKKINLPSIDGIKFSFDGDIVDNESTPEELDIDDDCVIDVMFSS